MIADRAEITEKVLSAKKEKGLTFDHRRRRRPHKSGRLGPAGTIDHVA